MTEQEKDFEEGVDDDQEDYQDGGDDSTTDKQEESDEERIERLEKENEELKAKHEKEKMRKKKAYKKMSATKDENLELKEIRDRLEKREFLDEHKVDKETYEKVKELAEEKNYSLDDAFILYQHRQESDEGVKQQKADAGTTMDGTFHKSKIQDLGDKIFSKGPTYKEIKKN